MLPYATWPHDAGKVGWFDPAPPTESWKGREQRDEDGLYKGFWHLFRTPDGIWISCFGLDEHRPFVRRGIGQDIPFWQVLPEGANSWFAKNDQSPPEILFKDIEAAKATSEQIPFKIRTPNGTVFTYGNASADHEIDVDAMAVDRIAEARRVDPMPDPENLTVGEMIDFITFIARVSREFQYLLPTPEVREQYLCRQSVLSASPGFREFKKWCQRTRGRDSSVELAQEFRGEVCKRLDGDFDDVNPLPLLDAVRLFRQPEAVSPPAPTREEEKPAAAPTSGTVTPIRPESLVDYAALAEVLRRQNKGVAARLVEFMADKSSAPCEDVAREVHGDKDTSEQTVRMNARRTSDELAKMGSPVSFRVTTGWVFKDISPE